MTSPLILHIPHASTVIPSPWREKILLDDAALRRELLLMTDMHTDELFEVAEAERVVAPVSRLLVDVERFADDAVEPMAARGMGVIYTKTSHLGILREPPGAEDRAALLAAYYSPHHDRLNNLAGRALDTLGLCLTVDCHSFPSRALPYEGSQKDVERPGICIGTDAFHTPPVLSKALLRFFQGRGYTVALDTPFSGALAPSLFYQREPRLHTVMIEVRRDLYMDEATGEKRDAFDRVRRDVIEGIGEALALIAEHRQSA